MHIAVIGSGNVGKALASGFHAAGHSVTMTSRDPEHALATARELGVDAGRSNAEAVVSADMVVLAIPSYARAAIAEEIRDTIDGKPVVDVTNVLNDDMTGVVAEDSGAQELQRMLPGAHVIKAFNTVFASQMAAGSVNTVAIDGLFAGDDAVAKEHVRSLLADMGYRPLDCGPLAMARALEEMALLNIRLNAVNGWSWQTSWKLAGPTA